MMKKILILLLFLGAAVSNAQVINFPDANLKTALINSPFVMDVNGNFLPSADLNFDGNIEVTEAQLVGTIMVENSNVSNLSGMEYFTNLKSFSCSGNQITSLVPMQNMTSLQQLYVANNQITTVDLSGGFTQLTDFDFAGNALTSLNLSGCSALTYINPTATANLAYFNIHNCSSITTFNVTSPTLAFIDFTGCTALNNLTIWNSQLTSLDFSNSPVHLISMQTNNQIASITFGNNPNLTDVTVLGSPITTMDVSGLPVLQSLWCANNPQLQTVFAKNGALESFILGNNPNLNFVCVDDFQVEAVRASLDINGQSNVACSSYCSFTPGGSYNTITGIVRFDGNNNGCDAGDITPNNVRLNITGGPTTGAAFLNNSGNYSFYTDAGNFTITPSVEHPTFFNFSPQWAAVPFPNNNNNTDIENFCITANGVHSDVEMAISPVMPARPGFDAVYNLTYKNNGNKTETVFLNFGYDASRLTYVSSSVTPTGSSPGSWQYMVSNVRPFENGSVTVTMHVNAPTDTPAVNVGDILHFTSFIDVTVDENWADNSFPYDQTVVGSFDPNDITCLEGGVVASTAIGDYLHYAINFENTGTDFAENIVVKMQVDPNQYNLGSLQLLNASHAADARVNGNIVEFIFKNINLNIGGHGHILLKLKTNAGLSVGATVSRRADIYFDYNLPVDTGLANTTFQLLAKDQFEQDRSVVVSPNPTTGVFSIKASTAIQSVELFDIQGRIVQTKLLNETAPRLDISGYAKGVYFVKVKTAQGSKIEKLVKE
jgi:hypothetical protein